MAQIALTGKYAVGPHAFATVDDDLYEYLSNWKWKAKPNGRGNNTYAVRNIMDGGRCKTLRMHRVVLGLASENKLEVDHRNHDGLDNRRDNLRAVTRSINAKNVRLQECSVSCQHCDVLIKRMVAGNCVNKRMTCDACKRQRAIQPAKSCVSFITCAQCGVFFTARHVSREYCSDRCRCAGRRARKNAWVPPLKN